MDMDDAFYLSKWLLDPNILKWFPMQSEREVEDSVKIWSSYSRIGSGLTACLDGFPVGNANLYIQPFKKLAHQCLLSIIVEDQHRGKGIGTALLKELEKLAKEKFHIELLHLEVYDGNPAIGLYRKQGFVEYGRHKNFIKEPDGRYIDKIYMQKRL
jgi:putative acetyltransferase